MKSKQKIILNTIVFILLSIFAIMSLCHQPVMTITQLSDTENNRQNKLNTTEVQKQFLLTNVQKKQPYHIVFILEQYEDGQCERQQVIYNSEALYRQMAQFEQCLLTLTITQTHDEGCLLSANLEPMIHNDLGDSLLQKQWKLLDENQYAQAWSFIDQADLILDEGAALVILTDVIDAAQFPEIAVFNKVVQEQGKVVVLKMLVMED